MQRSKTRNMPQRILQLLTSETADGLGYAVTGASISSVVIEWISAFEFNDLLQAVMFLGSSAFAVFKAYNLYLESRGKRLDNKIKRHQLRKMEKEDGDQG